MKRIFRKFVIALSLAAMIFSSVSSYAYAAPQLPQTITVEGREFVKDVSAGGGRDTATPDQSVVVLRANYEVIGSDVSMYIDYSHGHGGDQFASGWVQATAPRFYARAEIWVNGYVTLSATNSPNPSGSDIAESSTPLTVGINNSRTPRIFYGWL